MISGTIRRSALAARQSPFVAARRNLSVTPARMGGYHYPEGPRSNLPFNPLTKWFAVRYVSFCVVGFGLPFGIAVYQLRKNA
ncbi:cytochrome c oxidase subunit VIIc-domain-containing protein [Tricharina praecox]|uniref:cytochrome c oxidase subunit VIIc-domain-containing protein n=1 Tax=Tricharina praecox TaxID=43433 RepID=UPI002220294E|nr:cytochrome c oxidase subunit VIIc-domain-containing protein [Tricharina praecox]XP_051343667.1 cytochrome c oxidase subunit VIIc-domain-containing protein [Tricharina praecox]KAI5841295.1 cytochrome c oxidase subunit VIIc-domain-containing protein [Tricharina praecox]KAI5857921.1 cytochrome c oxidase subunit VIIc-domain-containing protein [Tricharina praecox]